MMPRAKSKKNRVRYVPVVDLPPLPHEAYAALRQNIAVHGVLVPILIAKAGANKKFIIDGNTRKAIADELGYDCPEIEQQGLSHDEMRMMARALNLARRQLDREGKRQIIAQQILECPNRSSCPLVEFFSTRIAAAARCSWPDWIMGHPG